MPRAVAGGCGEQVNALWGAGEPTRPRPLCTRCPQAEPGSFLGFETAFKGTGEPQYPGGVFDPLNISK